MTTEERNIAARRIMATRLRKMLHWSQRRGEQIPDDTIKKFIAYRLWRDWGYQRLSDCLAKEFGLGANQAFDLTVQAVKDGYEDEQLYRNNDDHK
jgi:hypothetical protein